MFYLIDTMCVWATVLMCRQVGMMLVNADGWKNHRTGKPTTIKIAFRINILHVHFFCSHKHARTRTYKSAWVRLPHLVIQPIINHPQTEHTINFIMIHRRIHSYRISFHLPAKRIWVESTTQNLDDKFHRVDSAAVCQIQKNRPILLTSS